MNIELSALEARVIGCLIEKQTTTPDQYPLSLNALTNACNQKNNREPVLDLHERAVQQILDDLVKKHFVIERSGFGSRVPKYQHVFCNTEFGGLKFTPAETAIICELLLRGPQMPGELRSRANRMCQISDVTEVEAALQTLMHRPDGPFIIRLAREAGRRENRYAHLFCGPVKTIDEPDDTAPLSDSAAPAQNNADRLARLEKQVDELQRELAELKRQLKPT